ncbi:PE family protein, partial [Mycobacterium gordonae]
MSYLIVAPEALSSAATDAAGIGSAIRCANAAAAAATTAVVAAGADEVSVELASLFSGHGQAYQSLSAQLSTFHDQLVQTLTANANTYARAEAANVSPLQQILNVVNAPTEALVGRPLIGDGTDGAAGSGASGGAGGILVGNGGNGGSGAAGQVGG